MSNSNTLNNEQRELVMKHIKTAYNLAYKYKSFGLSRGLSYDDLKQEACLGLCIAASKYDTSKGTCFNTYAYFYCRKAIQQALKIKVGSPLPDQINADDADESSADTMSVVDLIDRDGEEAEQREECYLKVEELLGKLPNNQRKVVCMVYGIHGDVMDFKQIGRELHLKQTKVKEMYLSAMDKMKAGTSLPALPFRERAFRTSGSRAA